MGQPTPPVTVETHTRNAPASTHASGNDRRIVVVGGGPAAHRFVTSLVSRGLGEDTVTVLSEEKYVPYDRVGLEKLFGDTSTDLTLAQGEIWEHPGVELHVGEHAADIDVSEQTVISAGGDRYPYDELILATGSNAASLNIPGGQKTHKFRTVDDVKGIVADIDRLQDRLGRAPRGVVVGGGLLGLEAAAGLKELGAEATILDVAEWLLSTEMDQGGGQAVNSLIGQVGIDVHCSTFISGVNVVDGEVVSVSVKDGEDIPADLVILAVGIRPREGLARRAGFHLADRGGVVVDERCATSVPHVWAIGEVASILGRTWGLVAPANTMADVVAEQLTGGTKVVESFDTATKLKFSGIDVASFGDTAGTTEGCLEIVYADPARGLYQKIVTSSDASVLLGGVFVGDAAPYDSLRPLLGRALPGEPGAYLSAAGSEAPDTELPDDAILCSCNAVSFGTVREAVREGNHDVPALKTCTNAGTQCGSCVPMLQKTLGQELGKLGLTMSKSLCEHFDMSRAELFEAVLVTHLADFPSVLERFGSGEDGCAVCKPTVASILHSIRHDYALDSGRGTLQDTNDRALANMQKDGTYSVVPRIPGGEITPEKLAVIARVGQEFNLYTKLTAAQRIGLFGARLEQLPLIWKQLVDAGFESGSAYGKALRNVKSCIGSTWCRFGVQDSVAMGINLENRYKGLRSPHKFKFGVSGCARECAEAQAKDVGVVATTDGWNLFLAGNGGANPVHGRLFAQGLDEDTLITYIDRFLLYYIRTADKLQRTARWMEDLDERYNGDGMGHLRSVIVDDSLGICADLDRDMETHVKEYRDEWAETLKDPERLRRFRPFVNEPETQDNGARMYVLERDQIRPATAQEIAASETGEGPVLVTGAKIPVGAPTP
ncbi:MAG: nitrite reductase large subunit NirB [Kocuria sp.]|nr:nitrite reductase large subunit NirB [Kocuria sp.]